MELFIKIFDEVNKKTRTIPEDFVAATSRDDTLESLKLDSLDTLLIWSELAVIYDVEDAEEMPHDSLGSLWDYIQENGKRFPESVDEAVDNI